MRVREDQARKSGKRAAADTPKSAHHTTEEALIDLGRYLTGQEHKPDVHLQMGAIIQDLNTVLDDEVLASMEQMFEDALFAPHVRLHDDVMNDYLPTFMLLKKLRELQKTRLRDAIERAVGRTPN